MTIGDLLKELNKLPSDAPLRVRVKHVNDAGDDTVNTVRDIVGVDVCESSVVPEVQLRTSRPLPVSAR